MQSALAERVPAREEAILASLSSSVRVPCVSVAIGAALHRYFVADGMWLPPDAYPPGQAGGWSDDEKDGNADSDEAERAVPHDEAVELAVRQALQRWKSITVKCDHVAPSDAAWMMPFSNARCTTLGHVYMAIKASDRVQTHLTSHLAAGGCTLHVQQWLEAPPSGEWRCYTRGVAVAFASQRYPVNAIDVNLPETGRRLASLWARDGGALGTQLARLGPLLEVDVWLLDQDAAVVLGVRVPHKEAAERPGVFTWDELTAAPLVGDAAVVVRALTGKTAMATAPTVTGVPADMSGAVDGALEALQQLHPAMLQLEHK